MTPKEVYARAYSLIRYEHVGHDDYTPRHCQDRDILAEGRLLPAWAIGAAWKSHNEVWWTGLGVERGKYLNLLKKKYATYYVATRIERREAPEYRKTVNAMRHER